MITNKLTLFILSIIPGLGHIALQQRKKGYMYLALGLAIFGAIYLAGAQHTDYTLPTRTVIAILLLVVPLYISIYTDLVAQLYQKDS